MKRLINSYGLYILVVIALLPIMITRDFTPDNELRYLSIAAESLRDHNIFAFYNHGLPYADKPPLYMWICMAGYALFGKGCMWFVLLFSVIPAFVVTEITARMCKDVLKGNALTAAKLMTLTSALFLGLAVTMRMDMLMCMFIVLSLRSYYIQSERCKSGDPQGWQRLLFPIWLFLGLFTKGPYGLLIPLAGTFLYALTARELRVWCRIWGWRCWVVLLTLCGGWFAGVCIDGGYEYLDNLLFHQTVGRAVNSFHHKEGVWYYFVSIWYSIAPWSLATVPAIIFSLFVRGLKRPEIEKYFLCIIAATFLLLSAMSSKLAVYLLPAFPYLIFAGAMAMQRHRDSKWIAAAIGLPTAAIGVAGLTAAFLLISGGARTFGLSQSFTPYGIAMGIILAVGCAWSVALLCHRTPQLWRSVIYGACAILAAVFAAGFGCDEINDHIGYSELVKTTENQCRGSGKAIYYNLRRGENIDVLSTRQYLLIPKNDSTALTAENIAPGSVVTLKEKDAEWLKPGNFRLKETCGKYLIYSAE